MERLCGHEEGGPVVEIDAWLTLKLKKKRLNNLGGDVNQRIRAIDQSDNSGSVVTTDGEGTGRGNSTYILVKTEIENSNR